MITWRCLGALLAFIIAMPVFAADVEGTIIVKRRLTKRRITPVSSLYERGAAVPFGPVEAGDPLAYERKHTVIYIEGSADSAPVSRVMYQDNRRFDPDFLVLPAGSAVSFPNLDPIFHNVFSLSKAKSFDLGNYSRGQTRAVTFSTPGIVLVNCRIHTNMAAVIFVTPNSLAALADAEGGFRIRGVPPGKHTVIAWHKAAGFFRKEIVVEEGVSRKLELFIPLEKDPLEAPSLARR